MTAPLSLTPRQRATPHQIATIRSLIGSGRTASRIVDCTGIPKRIVNLELGNAWAHQGRDYQRKAVLRLEARGLNQREIAEGLCAPEAAVQSILMDELLRMDAAS